MVSTGDSLGEPHEDGPPHRATVVGTTTVEMVAIHDEDRGLFHAAEHELVLAPGLSRLLLMTPPYTRDAYTVDHLLRLARSVEFFKQFSDAVVRSLCQSMTLARYSPGDVVFKQGNPGETFYVILTGSARVIVKPRHPGATRSTNAEQPSTARTMVRVKTEYKLSLSSENLTPHGELVGTMCTLSSPCCTL